MSAPDPAAHVAAEDGASARDLSTRHAAVDGGAVAGASATRGARSGRTRMIVIGVFAALVVLWIMPGGSVSWVRPALLALAAGVAAVWYWRRSGSHARRTAPAAPRAEDTRDLWDALDRGEDLTDETRV
ncbi:Trp biosynthesis-associated membrane protein [Catellatospora vulcania]|uniref:Trp biosynthesis-associated membrane protein n=1 Tax=Catellatospora vulcania TaxID=1460450 RepID=UPI0012D4801B|nr:Trp biosynthesis-associated membrane protein [Catellatospora vulcania]